MSIATNKLHTSHSFASTVALASSATAIPTFHKFLAAFRQRKLSRPKALQACLSLINREPDDLLELLEALPTAWADHAVASVYATLMPADRRKGLGVYFTPPHLVEHLVSRLASCGMDPVAHRFRDPAAGGAAFLVPLARIKVSAWKEQGLTDGEIVRKLQEHLVGREIEPDLATIANALIKRMLIYEFHLTPKSVARLKLVRVGDSLDCQRSPVDDIDHEIGNPPFLRISNSDKRLAESMFGEIVSGRVNLYALFVRRALAEVPTGGMIGYVIPTSFLGGPEFMAFRRRVLQLAEVLIVDLIEKRSEVFLDATQDACFVVLRRRPTVLADPPDRVAASDMFNREGKFVQMGVAEIKADGAPWRLPGPELMRSSTLEEWGYRAMVGYLVANRQLDRLHKRMANGRYPLVWAKAITPNGEFQFERGAVVSRCVV